MHIVSSQQTITTKQGFAGFQVGLAPRSQRCHHPRLPSKLICCSAFSDVPEGLVVLPVFAGTSVMLPAGQGTLRAFEKRYVDMFQRLASSTPSGTGQGAKFLHILSSTLAPPAMLESSPPSLRGLPAVGCCAVIQEIVANPNDGSLLVTYSGHRRLNLHYVEAGDNAKQSSSTTQAVSGENNGHVLKAAGEWFDDVDPELLGIPGGIAAVDAAERDLAGVVKQIAQLSKIVDPETSSLPEAIIRYAPPPPGQSARPTSYDALKASGHRAATAIDMWRRHGSVYSTQRAPEQAYADPYTDMAEKLGRSRRQEMFSFAVAQLLQLGKPEAVALLLTRDTAGSLQFVLEAARPYLAQLSATAALKTLNLGDKK